jgi:phenylacetate-coenzyme A ligase PaaK-like adenylate-forming protein
MSMDGTNTFPRAALEALLRSVVKNPHSSFYRQRLGETPLQPLTKERWEDLPPLAREEISSVPFWQRVFVAPRSGFFIRHTYGSSGKNILMTPRVSSGSYDEPYAHIPVKRVMNFFASAHHDFPHSETGHETYFGDVGNLDVSIALVKRAGIDMLYTTPYTALVMAEGLTKIGAIERIRVVQLCGERCSPLQFQTLKRLYSNAAVYGNFASSETRETVAVTCVHDREGGSLVMSAVPEVYCEIIDHESGKVIEKHGTYGDLVLTTLDPHIPFPLVRYVTGDIAAYTPRTCGCDVRARGFEIIGRASVFPVRLVKGELTVNAVEGALAEAGVPSEYFEVHYTEEQSGNIVLPRVSLVLVGEGAREGLAGAIAERLMVFPTYSYAEGVRAGLYLPLLISCIADAPPAPAGKPKSPVIVRHIAGNEAETQRASLMHGIERPYAS